MNLKMKTAKAMFGGLWIIGGGVLIVLLTAQTFSGLYGDNLKDVFDWCVPHVLPTVTLMLAVFIYDAKNPSTEKSDKEIGGLFFGVTMLFTGLYLMILIGAFLFAVYVDNRIEFYKQTSIPLGIIQGIITPLTAFFFQSK